MAKHKAYTAPSRQNPGPESKKEDDEASYEAASQSTADFVQSVEPIQKQRKKSRRLRKVLIILIVLALAGAGIYFLYQQGGKRSGQEESSQPNSKENAAEAEPEAESTALESYSSTDLKLSFDHPGNWQVDDSEQGVLTLESLETELPDESGQTVKAKVVMSIVPSVAEMDDFPADQATAVRESEKFAYDSPAAGQREETFLSFVNLDGPSEGLNAIYITGDSNYVKGDPVTKADFESVEPIVGIRFLAEGEAITIASGAWDENQTLASVLSILKSLNIK